MISIWHEGVYHAAKPCQAALLSLTGSVNDRERKMLKGRERIAQRRREEEKEAKIREKAQGDVRELMDQFSSW